MNVSLTPELQQFVQNKVESGEYLSAAEVVEDALRLLQERDQLRELRRERLRREIQVGVSQLDRGEGAPLDIEATKASARKRLAWGPKRTS